MKRELGELKSLGVFGICKEAYNIIFSSKKIFYQIILALLLPLTLITLTEIQLTRVLFGEFLHQKRAFELPNWPSFKDDDVLNWVTSLPTQESTLFWLFKFAFFLVDVFLRVLFSSAVVYTAACIYIAKPISFRKVMSAAPKAIMRLIITDLCSLVVFLGFSFAAVALFLGFYYLSNYNRAIILSFAAVGIITLPFVYLIGLVYILISWNLACAVSVLEDVDGVKALIKSFSLVKGKVLYATLIFVMMQLLNMAIECGWEALVAYGQFEGVLERVMRWTLYNPLLEVANLVRLVIQTVIYFVCKSYHQESIDKSRLADHLEVDMVDYLLLQNKEQFLISV